MTVELNHTIVYSRDKTASANALAALLGLPEPVAVGPFAAIRLSNDVTLDFAETGGDIAQQHYAFKVGEDEFQEIFGRIRAGKLDYWADPHRTLPGQANTNDGGHGVYFTNADNHVLELLTRDYGSED
ncbi:VOC family protein [Amycolatopsis sp. H20-H5]|uniref:VOC family protein n=1 Tax=Amycolatopsis sp. H20-H5 TaxID=3046309 RepID=UPI002DBF2227|nr:VOC family protein [Amycolatopsis sp. H20-H5]MEC3981816.1 VOC family protein [Amycolatopsis sp. H20-H5]